MPEEKELLAKVVKAAGGFIKRNKALNRLDDAVKKADQDERVALAASLKGETTPDEET